MNWTQCLKYFSIFLAELEKKLKAQAEAEEALWFPAGTEPKIELPLEIGEDGWIKTAPTPNADQVHGM